MGVGKIPGCMVPALFPHVSTIFDMHMKLRIEKESTIVQWVWEVCIDTNGTDVVIFLGLWAMVNSFYLPNLKWNMNLSQPISPVEVNWFHTSLPPVFDKVKPFHDRVK